MILPRNHVSPAWHHCICASPASPRLKKVKSQVTNAIHCNLCNWNIYHNKTYACTEFLEVSKMVETGNILPLAHILANTCMQWLAILAILMYVSCCHTYACMMFIYSIISYTHVCVVLFIHMHTWYLTVIFQGCGPSDWLKCAGVVVQCVEGNSLQACISCLESSYEQCKNCFNLTEAIEKQGLFQV